MAYANGRIPLSTMEAVRAEYFTPASAHQLRALEAAFARKFGHEFIINEGYRSLETQQRLYSGWIKRLPGYNLAAYPGTSNHGWGIAGDFGSGIHLYGSPQKIWMDAHAPQYGWHPAGNSFTPREAWHFEYRGNPVILAGGSGAAIPVATRRKSTMTTLYHDISTKNPQLFALAGDSPGTPANWLESYDYAGVVVPWARAHGDSVGLSHDSFLFFKDAYRGNLNANTYPQGPPAPPVEVTLPADLKVTATVDPAQLVDEYFRQLSDRSKS